MSLSSAFNNAFSGLNASSRRAELISNNISNAMTDGYSRREIALNSDVLNGFGGGVRIGDISRIENAVLTSNRRSAEATVNAISTSADFLSRFLMSVGQLGENGALAVEMSELESAFIQAANDPSNEIVLDELADQAKAVSSTINYLSESINKLRLEADTRIGEQVDFVNRNLAQQKNLNIEIRTRLANGGSIASLKDQQGILIDQLNAVIPVKVVKRDFGQVALFTPEGGTLLDGAATQFDFVKVPAMSPGMTLTNGALSDLVVNGVAASANNNKDAFSGGALGALFNARDNTLTDLSGNVDAIAADLILRFQSPLVDSTLVATDAAVFTDGGGQFLGVNTEGLASRIGVNSSVDPDMGGQSWRFRTGINALGPGEIGQNTTLRNYVDAMQAFVSPASGMSASNDMSATGFAGQFAAFVAHESVFNEDLLSFELTKAEEFKEAELVSVGVDTDTELQSLMEVETAYAANAKMMAILDELINRLLEI